MSTLKRKQVEYCVDGYNLFRSVEHKGLLNLLQTCVDYGAKYGKFDMAQILYSRDAVSRVTVSMAAEMKTRLVKQLEPMVQDSTVSMCLDMYTDDYQKSCTWTFMLRGFVRSSLFTMLHLQSGREVRIGCS